MLRLFPRRGDNPGKWKGFTVKAADKITLRLPEAPELFRTFGSHRGCRGLGPVCVEMCCIFAVLPRIPLAWKTARANTDERILLKRLLRKLRKRDLLLIDNGFYSFKLFRKLLDRCCSFIIPLQKNTRPNVVETLGKGDYLVDIADSAKRSRQTMRLRLVYVYREGFRRWRILTDLLDPVAYPPEEIAQLYHMRWDIETFYRDFKHTMQACKWHCKTPDSFHKELAMHMIAAVLIRTVMLEAARSKHRKPARLSFSRAVTEARIFFKRAAQALGAGLQNAYAMFVKQCARHVVPAKPGRSYPRDTQETRRKARGLSTDNRGRKPKQVKPPTYPALETLTTWHGVCYALS